MRPDRRRWLCVVPLVLVMACPNAGIPTQWRSVTPASVDVTFACAQTVVDSLGYSVTASDKASGFLRAQNVINTDTRDILLVTVVQSGTGTELHVTGESYGMITAAAKGMTHPSDKVVQDGSFIIARCGPTSSRA
jgi:hypothetical protein